VTEVIVGVAVVLPAQTHGGFRPGEGLTFRQPLNDDFRYRTHSFPPSLDWGKLLTDNCGVRFSFQFPSVYPA
jgi:hypothetical protein